MVGEFKRYRGLVDFRRYFARCVDPKRTKAVTDEDSDATNVFESPSPIKRKKPRKRPRFEDSSDEEFSELSEDTTMQDVPASPPRTQVKKEKPSTPAGKVFKDLLEGRKAKPSPVKPPNFVPRRNPHRAGRDLGVYNEDTLADLAAKSPKKEEIELKLPGEKDDREDEKQAEVPPTTTELQENPDFEAADPFEKVITREVKQEHQPNFDAAEEVVSLGKYDRSDIPLNVKAENLGLPQLQASSQISPAVSPLMSPVHADELPDVPGPENVVEMETREVELGGEIYEFASPLAPQYPQQKKETYMSAYIFPIVAGIFLVTWAVQMKN